MFPQVGRLVSVLLIVRMTPITTMTNQPSGELLETSSATVRVCERVSECVCVYTQCHCWGIPHGIQVHCEVLDKTLALKDIKDCHPESEL